MLSGIKDRRGIIAITGETGVGKTILIHALLKERIDKIRTAFVFNPSMDLKGTLENILGELGLPIQENGEDLFSLLVGFRRALNESLKQSETLAIVIDEAQSLDEEVLEGLFRLATPDSPDINALQIVLVGHPDLERKLNSEKFNSFKERITIGGRIPPLSREESRDYISYRLNLAGRNISELFTRDGVNRVLDFAKGNPRVINLLCRNALLVGWQESSPLIDSKIVSKAIRDVEHLRVRRISVKKKSWLKILRILFFLFSIGIFLLSLGLIFFLLLQD